MRVTEEGHLGQHGAELTAAAVWKQLQPHLIAVEIAAARYPRAPALPCPARPLTGRRLEASKDTVLAPPRRRLD